MLDFDLSEEHRLLEQTVRDWARARSRAAHPRARSRAPVRSRHPVRRWPSSACSGVSVPAEYGGAGMDYISLGLISEELEYVDTSLRVIMSVHAGLNCLTLLSWGTEDQKQRYLVPQAQGQKIATYGLTEPSAGSDVRGIQTVGRQEGRSLRPDRREDVDLAGGRRRQLPRLRLDGRGEEEAARSRRAQRVHRRARVQGLLERHAHAEVGHPRRQHRLLQDGRRRGAGREPRRPRGRGLQDRDVRARSGPLHGGRRRDRADPRLPRREQPSTRSSARRSASRSRSTSS